MNPTQPQQNTQSNDQATLNATQFNVGPIPYHTHDGTDSPQIDHRDLTNTPLVVQASQATPTSIFPQANTMVVVTALANSLTITNPSGTPQQGNQIIIRILDNGSNRNLIWGSQYRAVGNALPANTTASKTMYLGFEYNMESATWDCIASATQA